MDFNPDLPSKKRYVDIRFLTQYLSIKEPTIRDWIRFKKIPFFRIGKCIRFDLTKIDDWLKEKEVDI